MKEPARIWGFGIVPSEMVPLFMGTEHAGYSYGADMYVHPWVYETFRIHFIQRELPPDEPAPIDGPPLWR